MGEIKASVIVPVRNKKNSINILKNMWKRTNEKNCEMIIVFDNYAGRLDYGEPDEDLCVELIKVFKGYNVRVLRSSDSKYEFNHSEKTFRVAAAVNWGVQNATGKYVLISSDDYFYTHAWLEILLKLSERFDMKKTVLHPVNVESFEVCSGDTNIKEKMWSTLRETGRRYFFGNTYPLTESKLIEYWNNTKMETFDLELNCGGPFGNTCPLFMLRSLWLSMDGRKLSRVSNSETEFHDRLKTMGVTKVIPRNVYIFNHLIQSVTNYG